MKKTEKRGLGGVILRVVFAVMMTAILSTVSKSYALGGDIAETELKSISLWKSGYVDEKTGKETANSRRICTKDYYSLQNETYEVSVFGSDFTARVFYYDADMNFISSEVLYDGCVLSISDKAKYARFDVRKNSSEKSMSLGQFGRYIGSAFYFSFTAKSHHETAEANVTDISAPDSYELFEKFSSNSVKGWVSAGMDSKTGEVIVNRRRLVTEELFPIYEQTLSIEFSQSGFNVEIYEYDENEKFVKMSVATDGSEVAVSDKTRYVRFSLYRVQNEKSLSLGQWNGLFSGGLTLSLSADEATEKVPENVKVGNTSPKVPNNVDSEYAALYEEMKKMLTTGDKSVHNISKYNVSATKLLEIEKVLRTGEGKYYYSNSCTMYLGNFGIENNKCKTMQFVGMDEDFINRYNRMMAAFNEIKSMVTADMSDLDKVILVHQYLIEKAYYEKTSNVHSCAGGILGDGHGLCAGFAFSFIDVMNYLGIDARYVSSEDMNHAWNVVRIDGHYYHVDVTWDNTKQDTNGIVTRNYLMASDTRYKKNIPNKHYNWSATVADKTAGVNISAASTKFDDWFVHDVQGKMVYANGYWYYADGKTIKKSDAYGTKNVTVLTESANVSIIGVSQGKIQYKVNGVVKTTAAK